jgi:hypothetical protein
VHCQSLVDRNTLHFEVEPRVFLISCQKNLCSVELQTFIYRTLKGVERSGN